MVTRRRRGERERMFERETRCGCSMRASERARGREIKKRPIALHRDGVTSPPPSTRARRSLAQADGLLHGLDSILWIGRRGGISKVSESGGGWDGAGRIGSDEFVYTCTVA